MKFVQVRNIPSDRIKCIIQYNNHIVCGLHTGLLLIHPLNLSAIEKGQPDKNVIKSSKSVQISKMAVRGMATTTNLIVCSDDGYIHFIDNTFKKLRSLKVHNDFIRKVRTSEHFIFTCSDDFLIKKISNLNDEITILQGHEHFIMDMAIIDSERLLSCSLDMTLKIWNYKTDLCISTLRAHTRGINSLAIHNQVYYSVGDDHCIRIWQNNLRRTIENVSRKNIDHIKIEDNCIYTGGEDGHLRIYDIATESLKKDLSVGPRIWDSLSYENFLFVGSDTGLMIFKNEKEKIEQFYTNRGILSIKGKNIYLNDKQAFSISQNRQLRHVTSNNKMVCLQYDDFFSVYSYLGFREKMNGRGLAHLVYSQLNTEENKNDDVLLVLKNGSIYIYHDLEEKLSFDVLFDNFKTSPTHLINYCDEGFSIYDFSGNIVLQQEMPISDCYILQNCVIIISRLSLRIIPFNYDEFTPFIDIILPSALKNAVATDNVLYYQISDKLYYLLPNGHFSHFSSNPGKLLGMENDHLVLSSTAHHSNKVSLVPIDPIISWQQSPKNEILSGREKECLQYLIAQKNEQKALELFPNKFEVYIELNNLYKAYKIAQSHEEFKLLGNNHFIQKRFKKAARCFHKSEDLELEEICQFLSGTEVNTNTLIGIINHIVNNKENPNPDVIEKMREYVRPFGLLPLFDAYYKNG